MDTTQKVAAAKKLCNALTTILDFAMYLDAHPNETRAMERLEADLELNKGATDGKEESA